jgi:hypothetical protein
MTSGGNRFFFDIVNDVNAKEDLQRVSAAGDLQISMWYSSAGFGLHLRVLKQSSAIRAFGGCLGTKRR